MWDKLEVGQDSAKYLGYEEKFLNMRTYAYFLCQCNKSLHI